jgi:type I restriction enzyme S subunit
MSFFSIPDQNITDKIYRALKHRSYRKKQDLTKFVETLYEKTKPFLDSNLDKKSSTNFHAHFWEMYLCYALLLSDKTIVKRRDRKNKDSEGPDLLVKSRDQNIWIEAVTVGAGIGSNKVVREDSEDAPTVPEEQIKLRLTSAIQTKQLKFKKYREQGIIDKNAITLISLNAKNVPLSVTDQTVPRIVRCLFGIGNLTYSFDKNIGSFTDSYYQQDSNTQNPNQEEIRFDNFLTDQYSHISAVIYSIVDIYNMPKIIGNDLTIVYNPNAINPLQTGFLSVGQEFYLKEEDLINQRHY